MNSEWLEHVWMDGKLVAFQDATTHVSSDFVLRGLSVFEGLRAYPVQAGPFKGAMHIVALERHRRRMLSSAQAIGLPIDETIVDAVIDGAKEMALANFDRALYLRPTIALESGAYSANPKAAKITSFVLGRVPPFSRSTPRTATFSRWRHVSEKQFPVHAKVGAQYAQYHLVRAEAESLGFDEAIMLNDMGNVAETGGASVFMVSRGVMATPSLSEGILPSVTRSIVLEIARASINVDVEERPIDRNELIGSSCAFLAGTLDEIAPLEVAGGSRPLESDAALVDTIAGKYRRLCCAPTTEDVITFGSTIIGGESRNERSTDAPSGWNERP